MFFFALISFKIFGQTVTLASPIWVCAPQLEFLNPEAFEDKTKRSDARAEFYPKGAGVANDAKRSPSLSFAYLVIE